MMLLIALLREPGRDGPPFHTSDDDVINLYKNSKLIESEEDESSKERLGKIIQNIYYFKPK